MERKPKGLALKASAQSDIEEEKEDVEHDETISLLTKRFSRFLKKKNRVGTNRKEGILNRMNPIPLTTLALVVVKQGISRWTVQTINQRTNQPARRLKGARGEELTSLGKRMKCLQQVALQLKVRKPICAS